MSRADRRIGLFLLGPVLAAIVFSWVRLVASSNDVPRDRDYVLARRVLGGQNFDPSRDALVTLPAWSLRPLQFLGDLSPLSGDNIEVRPLHRYARLFVLRESGADREHDALVARYGAPAVTEERGNIRVERFDLPAPSMLYDLSAHVQDAHVSVIDAAGVPSPCMRAIDNGVSCGREGWQRVTREWLLVSENGDRAVWSHPPVQGKKLEIRWPDIVVGTEVIVRAGFTRHGADSAQAPVQLRVFVNDTLVGTVTRAPSIAGFRNGFIADAVDTRAWAGKTAEIAFVIDTEDNGASHFAWDALVVNAASAP